MMESLAGIAGLMLFVLFPTMCIAMIDFMMLGTQEIPGWIFIDSFASFFLLIVGLCARDYKRNSND